MTDRQYVTRACETLGIDLLKPSRRSPGILGMHWVNGYAHRVIDADTWAKAREQVNVYARQRAA